MAPNVFTRWAGLGCVGGLAIMASVLACANPSPRETAGGTTTSERMATTQLPECPLDSVAVGKDTVTWITQYDLVGEIQDVPEFHDCQRFINGATGRYGPLVAIYASHFLDSLVYRLDSLGKDAPGGRVGLAAALILSLDGDYQPLGIEQGFSCLYLWRNPQQRKQPWQAKIQWVDLDHKRCLDPIYPAQGEVGTLSVFIDPLLRNFKSSDYPPVARWDWDPKTKRQYIGIKCGPTAWCHVGGRPGALPATLMAAGGQGNSPEARVLAIRGWHDEQYLAAAHPGGGVRRSRLKGTIIPDPAIDRYDNDSDYKEFVPFAYIALVEGPPLGASDPVPLARARAHYKTKFNLDMVPVGLPLSSMNRLDLCRGTRESCRVPKPQFGGPPICQSEQAPAAAGDPWWQRITAAKGGPPKYTCVTFEDHNDLAKHIPGTTRWRWEWDDESAWGRCTNGCCNNTSY